MLTGHGLTDRALHLLVMSGQLGQYSFDRECRRNDHKADRRRENLFIAGMARSGSTALLNILYASGQFAATTYQLMPFILAPSMAGRLSTWSKSNGGSSERAQGDGIQVNAQSPEALDGIFWSTFYPGSAHHCSPGPVPEAVLEKYAMFIENLLAAEAAQQYLSKMNQGIDKLESLARYFTQSIFLIPFRNPLQQSMSLLRQHRRFSNLSWYEKRYLNWQQHYEFGDLHRGIRAGRLGSDPGNLDYWLNQWRQGYRYLSDLARQQDNLILLCYETLASSTQPWRQLEERLNIDLQIDAFINRNRATPAADEACDQTLLDDCMRFYHELCDRCETGRYT